MTPDSHSGGTHWPAALSAHVDGGRLRFVTRGAHPFVAVAVPFALVLGALGIAGLAGLGDRGVVALIAAIVSTAVAVAVFASAAYSSWGSMDVERRGAEWVVTRALGRLRSVSTFAGSRVQSVAFYSPPPFVVFWPGGAGLHLHVHLSDRERPVEIGAGLRLDRETLEALRILFTPTP